MDQGVGSFLSALRDTFGFADKEINTYSPLTLAYIGDAVFDLVIRTLVVEEGNCPPSRLHKKTSAIVKAGTQARMMETLLPLLSEKEAAVYRRGKNSKPYTMAKNATRHDYLAATGFEAVMGYLYLTEQTPRMLELIRTGLNGGKEKPDEL